MMKHGELIIENKEYDQLITLIRDSHNQKDQAYRSSIDKLVDELKSAKKVTKEKLPSDVIRFNSVVNVQFENGQRRSLQLVLPQNSDVALNKISMLAPMGLALIGYASGDKVEWKFPSGLQTIQILGVEQPQENLEKSRT